MEVTEKYLSDIGGWQAMKSARDYVRTSSVSEISRDGNHFRGMMQVGGRKMRVSLDIKDARRVEVKCACREAQQGMICAHGLAVALSSLQAARPELSQATSAKTSSWAEAKTAAPKISEIKYPKGRLFWYLSMDQWSRLPQGSIPIFLKFEPDDAVHESSLGPWMVGQGIPFKAGGFRLTSAQLAPFLDRLLEHPRVYAGTPKDPQLTAMEVGTLQKLQVEVQAQRDEFMFCASSASTKTCEIGPAVWFWDSDALHLTKALESSVDSSDWQRFLLDLFSGKKSLIRRSRKWVLEHLIDLKQQFAADGSEAFQKLRLMPLQPKWVLQLDGNFKGLRALLQVDLGKVRYVATATGEEQYYPIQDARDLDLFWIRNLEREVWASERLQRWGFKLHAHGYWELVGEKEVMEFYAAKLERVTELFPIEEGPQWAKAKQGVLPIKPRLQVAQGEAKRGERPLGGEDWLSLEVDYIAPDGFRIPRNDVLRLIRSGKRDMPGPQGKRYLLDIEACEDLEDTLQDAETRLESGGRVIGLKANRLPVMTDFVKGRHTLLEQAKKGTSLQDTTQASKDLGELGKILRPYQLEGVAWLKAQSQFSGGGLLADEMGLGKTLQTLAFLKLIKAGSSEKLPSLIVCPSSLLFNWKDEATKFVPELKVHLSHETQRKKFFEVLGQFDVVVTSYALVVRDLEMLQKHEFDAVVLDEASYIRNADTETSKAVKALQAQCRIALTGTPVENSIKDLWSIFQFALPQYLPSQEKFHERFVKPLQSALTTDPESARTIMHRLKRLVNPYLLRRTKREVAKELPDKLEKVLFAELTREQKEVYQRLLEEGRQEIRDAKKRAGKGAARMTMFTILLRLRQVCNDLRLLKTPGLEKEVGGKWEVLEETFQEFIQGGHKAIIFSQFVGMLHLLRDKLEEMGISYSYLDGSSQDRAAQVAAFQKDKTKQFFLISLKAGGYGLTLTEADQVVLVDPWWNPAVEAQAIDRAHRIGQERPVTAYRVIARGTVEEKILKLQESKRKVIDMALEEDAAVMSGFSDDELEQLFED